MWRLRAHVGQVLGWLYWMAIFMLWEDKMEYLVLILLKGIEYFHNLITCSLTYSITYS